MARPGDATTRDPISSRSGLTAGAVVVVPVKAFAAAKARLSGVMDRAERAHLARAMADRVVLAAVPLPVVVACDDDEVERWAGTVGATAARTVGTGLNDAVQECVALLGAAGVPRVVVAHADLPFAEGLAALADATPGTVLLVPDRRRDGTNVISVPTDRGFTFHYGPGSFAAHCAETERCGLTLRVVESEALGWDVDDPGDLDTPHHLGPLPSEVAAGPAGSAAASVHPVAG